MLDLLSLMLLKYSEGFIRLFESALPGKLGGIKGNTLCLLTKCDNVDLDVSASFDKVIMVKSEQELLSLREAKKSKRRLVNTRYN